MKERHQQAFRLLVAPPDLYLVRAVLVPYDAAREKVTGNRMDFWIRAVDGGEAERVRRRRHHRGRPSGPGILTLRGAILFREDGRAHLRWVLVLRGEGHREHPAMPFETIRKCLGYLHPVLTDWAARVTSLREIAKDDVRDALAQRPGPTGRDLLSALHSLFQALKQERLVFRDPTRGASLSTIARLPVPIPTDRLRGLVDRASTPMAKFVVALVAIHGLGRRETRYLLLTDLDLARGRLTVRRDLRHTVHLDELTHTLASDWLRDRHLRWPLTATPYLLVSQQTVADDRLPPVSTMVMNDIFRPLGLSPSKLRQDRILDEARHTADPVHLMRVFGIAAETAMKYISAAHPERRPTLWR